MGKARLDMSQVSPFRARPLPDMNVRAKALTQMRLAPASDIAAGDPA